MKSTSFASYPPWKGTEPDLPATPKLPGLTESRPVLRVSGKERMCVRLKDSIWPHIAQVQRARPLRGKEENKATEERKLALGLVHTAGQTKDRLGSGLRGDVKRHFNARSKNRSAFKSTVKRTSIPLPPRELATQTPETGKPGHVHSHLLF